MSQLTPKYDPRAVEAEIYSQWEASGAFSPQTAPVNSIPPFVMMLPPPNITGTLHMGHALQDTVMDILARYHRMKGETVLWVPGMDHAALPTNKIIIDQLAQEGKKPEDIGREAFLERANTWYGKTGAAILNQMKRLGVSADWSRSRFTMDDAYYAAVQESFILYYERGYIYRGARIVNWDPKTQTTVSDLEIEYQTEKAPYYYFQYGPFVISTARPETKFGDKYVVMHPRDERYVQYKHGDTFEAEWINGPIHATIIKDEAADPTVGSGVMTITPWHSVADFEIAERHTLDMEQIIDFAGTLLPIAGEFAGQSIAAARPKIVKKLEEKGLLVKIEKKYEHNVAVNDRGKGMIEPQVMRQWFVDMSKLKEEAIQAASEGHITFVPPRWQKHFLTWMNNIRDWNINRQIWLGHRIPVWWKEGTHGTDNEEGNFAVSIEKPTPDEGWQQDPDVLDTWFSSALWPFATLGWPNDTEDLRTYYPTSVLVTGRDILYLWVARMIFSGLELMKGKEFGERDISQRIPFRQVFIHPTVLTKEGKRMSKSLGTGVDPLELIELYGADATRFGLMSQMSYDSQAIRFDESDVKAGRNFATKIWNIARLLSSDTLSSDESSIADEWIKQRFSAMRDDYYRALDEYKVGEAARLIYGFVWNDFADWYLEILKQEGSQRVAREVFIETLKLIHPVMPHISEVLWPAFGQEGLLIAAPLAQPLPSNKDVSAMSHFQEVVTTVRSIRTLLGIPVGAHINLWVQEPVLPRALAAMTRSELAESEEPAMHHFPISNGHVSLASEYINSVSLAAAAAKLEKEINGFTELIDRLTKQVMQMEDKAPAAVLAEKQAQIIEWTNQRTVTQASHDALTKK